MLGSNKEIYLFSILIFSAFLIPAFANENSDSLILETDYAKYQIGDEMIISGMVEIRKMPVVALKIFEPNGGILSANQVALEDDNTFSKSISLDSPFYDEAGTYTITMNYGKLETETHFDMELGDSFDTIIEDDSNLFFPEIIGMFTDQDVYQDGDIVTILGLVSEKDGNSVLIGIYDPFGTPAGFYFGDIDSNDEFSVSFLVKAGVNFKTEGIYSVSAFYGDSEANTNFEYIEHIETFQPEIIDDEIEDEKVVSSIEEEKLDDDVNSSDSKEKIIDIQNPQVNLPNSKLENDEYKKTIKNPENNLSVEDIELGIMLNQINLRCDTSEFVDTISYYDSMGPALIRLCKYDEAIYYYDQSLIKEPNNVEILTNKGSALAKMGFYNEAIIHYDSALTIDHNNFLALNNKANALANLGSYEDAISFYEQALIIAPAKPVILKNLERAQDKSIIIEDKISEMDSLVIFEQEENLIRSSNQESVSIFDQIGKVFSSIFSFLS